MQSSTWAFWAVLAYVVLFIVCAVSFAVWRAKSSKTKLPLEFKLLRAPGESLRRRVIDFQDSGLVGFIFAALVPLLCALATLQAIIWFAPKTPLVTGLTFVGVVLLVTAFFAGRFCVRRLMRYRNDSLGYLGERAVGEALEPLARDGFRIFHDVPGHSNGKKFNVDHVVVGPNGVFAIETKTRRKGKVRPGYEAHKVAYDGHRLIWPWAEDSHGLDQATSRAAWLADWLKKMTGLSVTTRPVLVLPGWYVVPQGLGPVMVLNHKQVVSAIGRLDTRVFTADQVDLIARQLDAICRDVED